MKSRRTCSTRTRDGFTLLELITMLALTSILGYASIVVVADIVDNFRVTETLWRLERIRDALIGDSRLKEGSARVGFGYFNDIGAAPSSLGDLITQPAGVAAFAQNSASRQGVGWRGPYLTSDQSDTSASEIVLMDGWGRAWSTDFSGSTWTVKSFGADGSIGGTGIDKDLGFAITSSARFSTVLGIIQNPDGTLNTSAATVELYQPNTSGAGTIQSRSVAASSGRFSFTSVPFGRRSLKVTIGTTTIGPIAFAADQPYVAVTAGLTRPKLALSLRKLISGYSGPAVNIRRSSDNTTSDISFTAAGAFDSSAFTTFVGASTAYVTTWYDQSGNGYHATQSTAANQPTLTLSGSTPSMDFSGSQYLDTGKDISFLTQSGVHGTVVAVMKMANSVNSGFGVANDSNGGRWHAHANWPDGVLYLDVPLGGARVSASNAANVGIFAQYSFIRGSTTAIIRWAGAQQAINSSASGSCTAPNSFMIGTANGNTWGNYTGSMREFLMYDRDLNGTVTLTAMESSQRTYWGTP